MAVSVALVLAVAAVGALLVAVAPWDHARAVRTPPVDRLTVTGEGASRVTVAQVRHDAGDALRYVRGVWDGEWSAHVVVDVPPDGAGFRSRVGRASVDGEAAVALIPRVGEAGPSAREAARVIINPDVYERLSAEGRQVVLRHELTHLASANVTGPGTPTWLVEGLAETVGHGDVALSVTRAATELAAEVRSGWLPDALPDDAAFTAADGTVPRSYQEAWLACRLIAETVGLDGLIGFYRRVGSGEGDPRTRLAAGFQAFLGTTEAGFVLRWRSYLRTRLSTDADVRPPG
ncbi:hypothetical protein [Frankia sp. Cas4]|uniref:hypothetical protein n=1 Tax=Frankia sp. Cas4 TaxID=3073927 RepID=UPI002AD3E006|nr:hypothetical protein [Frankia sp. Cas4]